MPCLVGCFALFFPRLAIVLVWLLTDYFEQAYQTLLWPLLGFFFMPLTALAYAFAWHQAPQGNISGVGLVVLVIAVLIDLGFIGGGAHPKTRVYYARTRR